MATGPAVAYSENLLQYPVMISRAIAVDEMTAEERLELIGRLWDSLDPAAAAPVTDALVAELDRRETDADATPDEGDEWPEVKAALSKKLW